jgi:dipeptide/tripeptide permease
MCINVGALVGGLVIPIMAQTDVFIAYVIPVVALSLGVLAFLLGTKRYVRMAPQGETNKMTLKVLCAALSCFSCSSTAPAPQLEEDLERASDEADSNKSQCCKHVSFSRPSLRKVDKANGGKFETSFVDNIRMMLYVIPISALIVPFNVAYSQMATTFIVQGTVMENAGFIDAAMMQNADALSVLFFGFVVSQFLYPALARRNIRLKTTHKFAIGTLLGCVAMICSIIVDWQIHAAYEATNEKISILWQAFSFVFIGAGEIFAISAAYEAAFVIAPKEQKAFASAINLFFIGAIPNFISSALYNGCSDWFTNSEGTTELDSLSLYASANVIYYFVVLLAIGVVGALICVIPAVTNWVSYIEDKARAANESESSNHSTSKSLRSFASSRVMDSSAMIRLHE